MHAETLKHLYNHIVKAKTILDIGSGSGFITAAMAHAAPHNAVVYGVDHIQGINDFAQSNVKKCCPHLIKKNKILFVTQDGREGLTHLDGKALPKFDVIHVGGQIEET